MEYTLAELASRGTGICERKQAISNAAHDNADLRGKALVIDAFLKFVSEGTQAIVVAEILAAAKSRRQSKANGLTAGVGEVVVNGVDVGGHELLSDGDVGELAYVLKYLRKAISSQA